MRYVLSSRIRERPKEERPFGLLMQIGASARMIPVQSHEKRMREQEGIMCRTQNRWGLVLAVMAIGCVVAPKGSRAESPQRVKARKVVEKLKGTRIISIQDYDKMNAIDQEGMAGVWGDSPVNEYDRNYRKRLTEYLGITVIKKSLSTRALCLMAISSTTISPTASAETKWWSRSIIPRIATCYPRIPKVAPSGTGGAVGDVIKWGSTAI